MSTKTYFISGHLDLSPREFAEHYASRIDDAILEGAMFIVADAKGADAMAQTHLAMRLGPAGGLGRVTVFHMLTSPRHNVSAYPTRGGFKTDDARDEAMTDASSADIAWVRPGRKGSGTSRNLQRRAARATRIQPMPPNSMLTILDSVEAALPGLLTDMDGWQTLDVDYEPPRVERLWRPIDDSIRVYLHRIHPCETALFHPHPWPSAVRVLSGSYEMDIGYGPGQQMPPLAARTILTAGSRYEMVDPDSWHSVRPLGGPSLSIMVTGKPWSRWSPKPHGVLHGLPNSTTQELIATFWKHVCRG